MLATPREISTSVMTVLPDRFHWTGPASSWAEARRRPDGTIVDSFLEGPSFDRDGNLWVTDIPYGRVFRITPDGDWDLIVQYDGEPNGLKIHRDGRVFIADRLHGIMVMDPAERTVRPYCSRASLDRFRGLNDLFFGPDGSLYFTDMGRSSLERPYGRVYRLSPDGAELETISEYGPSPNGLVLDGSGHDLLVAMTRANAIWRIALRTHGMERQPGVFIQMSGGNGPDGMALDEAGNIAVVQARSGLAFLFSPIGEPLLRIRSCAGLSVTNLAYGGHDRRTLFILESSTGTVLTAPMDVPGRALFSHT